MPIILLPGIGADARLFYPQTRDLEGVQVAPWAAPASRTESIEAYAARLAPRIPTSERYLLGGFSFGGMVAMEMVRYLSPKPAGLVLICGVRGRHQLTPAFLRQQRLGHVVPNALARRLYGPYAKRFARKAGLDPVHRRLLIEMARDCDPGFVKWSAWATAHWKGEPQLSGGSAKVPIRHIHGERDSIIPDVHREAHETIEGGGHLITWTHAKEVNAFLEACREELAGTPKATVRRR